MAAPVAVGAFQRTAKTGGVLLKSYSDLERVVKNNDIYALDRIIAQLPPEHRPIFTQLKTATKINFYQSGFKTPEQKAAALADKTQAPPRKCASTSRT